ncbi:MAG: Kdo domain containing protein [Flavobacteriaceae bacterium]|nr:Kdo domain containing protein [Flavobacteriaceae bacterium]
MNIMLNKNFENLKNDLFEIISNYSNFDNAFGTGKRNSLKKIDLGDRVIVVKSFKIPHPINKFVYRFLRSSKAQRSYEYATKLIELGIKTPTPIAFIEHFSILGLFKSYYISEFVDYTLAFRDLINQPNYPKREKILRAFTKFTFDLHQKGIRFLDHSPGNTLIVEKNNEYNFYLVDLNRMNFGDLNYNERMKNFSRLTPRKEMFEIMSDEYAKLYGKEQETVFESMWDFRKKFEVKLIRKKRLKKLFSNK